MVLLFLIVIAIIAFIFWLFKFEHFAQISPKANAILKKELGVDKCSSLFSDALNPDAIPIAKSFIDTGRIKDWKPQQGIHNNHDNVQFCYLPYNDTIMSGKICDKSEPLFQAPFLKSVFQSSSEQTTTTQNPKVCVMAIDKSKVNDETLNSFWNSNVGPGECQRANAYIIDLYKQLLSDTSNLRSNLANIISFINSLLVKSNDLSNKQSVILSNIVKLQTELDFHNHQTSVLKNDLVNLGNQLGLIQKGIATYSASCSNQILNLENDKQNKQTALNTIMSAFSNQSDQYIRLHTVYNETVSAYNIFKPIKLSLIKSFEQLNKTFNTNLASFSNLNVQLSNCTTVLHTKQTQFNTCSTNLSIMYNSNLDLQQQVTICRTNYNNCSACNFQCGLDVSSLESSIQFYNDELEKCKINNIDCSRTNAVITQNILALNKHYDWVRSVYIYLSCADLDQKITNLTNTLSDTTDKCKAASNAIHDTVANANNNLKFVTDSNVNSLSNCTSKTTEIRNDLLNKMYPETLLVKDFATCKKGEVCPINSTNITQVNLQDWCDSYGLPGAVVNGKWANIDGQRGGVYCSAYGSSKDVIQGKSNLTLGAQAGSVLPFGSFWDDSYSCTVDNYNLTCDTHKFGRRYFNFEFCINPVNFNNNSGTFSCRPSGADTFIQDIAICEQGETCKFASGSVHSSPAELTMFCNKYLHNKDGLQSTGKSISLVDGRQGAYCTYWGDKKAFDKAKSRNHNIEKLAFNFIS